MKRKTFKLMRRILLLLLLGAMINVAVTWASAWLADSRQLSRQPWLSAEIH